MVEPLPSISHPLWIPQKKRWLTQQQEGAEFEVEDGIKEKPVNTMYIPLPAIVFPVR